VTELQTKIKEKFGLQNVFVSKTFVNDEELIKRDVGKHLAEYLSEIIKPEDVLGVSWGTTLGYVTNYLKNHENLNVKVVQLNGGVSKNTKSTGSIALLEEFSRAFAAEFHLLPLPTIVDSEEIVNVVVQDTTIEHVIELGVQANIALFGIGQASKKNILYKAGYFSEHDFDRLLSLGAVGDICSRYFDINGHLVDSDLDNRTIGLQLNSLKEKEH